MATWMIRAGRKAAFVGDFREKSVVAIGWERIGTLSDNVTKDEIINLLDRYYPEDKRATHLTWASLINRFISEVAVGDGVVTYDPSERVYLIGEVKSACLWKPELIAIVPRIRKVV